MHEMEIYLSYHRKLCSVDINFAACTLTGAGCILGNKSAASVREGRKRMANTMLALVYRRETGVQLETRPVPSLQHPRDAIVKVIRSTICTSDLHIKNGFVPRAASGIVLGHEFVGEVVECGRGVTNVKPGDRVAANCETFCGECWFCKKGFINNCQVGGWELGCHLFYFNI